MTFIMWSPTRRRFLLLLRQRRPCLVKDFLDNFISRCHSMFLALDLQAAFPDFLAVFDHGGTIVAGIVVQTRILQIRHHFVTQLFL